MAADGLLSFPPSNGRGQDATRTEAAALRFLAESEIRAYELIPWGSNYTFAVLLHGADGAERLAIYKPRRGEVPLSDFPNGTLYRREVAAYLFARALGWDFIPPTVCRDGPHGIGSVQLYVDHDPNDSYRRFRGAARDQLQRIALFDLIANNADRKGGHCLRDRAGKLWGIDHGLTFHTVFKLRTVIWDFCGQPIPPGLLDTLRRFRDDAARVAETRAALGELLSRREVDAVFDRLDRVLETGTYPDLDPYRNVPWPPF
jgi:hypothetical protein